MDEGGDEEKKAGLTRSDVVSNQLVSIEEIGGGSVRNSISIEEGGGGDLEEDNGEERSQSKTRGPTNSSRGRVRTTRIAELMVTANPRSEKMMST